MSIRFPATSVNNVEVSEQLLNVFQAQKQQLHKMKQQNKILTSLNQKVLRKDEEIEQLQKLVKRYKKYYDQYELIKATLNQKIKQMQRLSQENKILFHEMNKIMGQNKQLQEKLLQVQKMKHEFVKQRNSSDARHRQIEQTFRQYQEECKNKIREMARDLEKAHQHNKQLDNKLQNLHSVKFQNEQLRAKISNFNTVQAQNSENETGEVFNYDQQQNLSQNRTQNVSGFINPHPMTFHSQALTNNQKNVLNFSKSRQKSPNKSHSRVYDQDANAEIQRLRRQLISKQMQLQRSKALNHQLSIQFDKSVSKICQFQKQLSMYRKQNHELKKTLSLFVQKQQYQKMHKDKIKSSDSEDSNNQQQQQSQEDHYMPGGYSHSESRR